MGSCLRSHLFLRWHRKKTLPPELSEVSQLIEDAGVEQVPRDVILGHSLHGMDAHYMAPSIDDLHRAMEKYTEWLDGQLILASVDQNVDQEVKKG